MSAIGTMATSFRILIFHRLSPVDQIGLGRDTPFFPLRGHNPHNGDLTRVRLPWQSDRPPKVAGYK